MQLSLREAATRLGKTPRQVRYLIQTERLAATKVGGTWVIDEAALGEQPGMVQGRVARGQDLRAAVDAALAPHEGRSGRYSVRSIRAFEALVAITRVARETLPGEPALACLQRALVSLSQGAHAFHRRDKVRHFVVAREELAQAVALLHLTESPEGPLLADRVEAEAMGALGGLLRRQERRAG